MNVLLELIFVSTNVSMILEATTVAATLDTILKPMDLTAQVYFQFSYHQNCIYLTFVFTIN